MGLNLALAGATAPAGGLLSFLPTILMFVVLIYFMIIRPQKKRQKNAQTLLESIRIGDKVQTIGGFIGEITEMGTDEFVLLSENSKLRIKRNAVAIKLNANEVTEVQVSEAPVTEAPVIEATDADDEDFKIEDFEI